MEKNYNRYFEQARKVMHGVCYKKISEEITREFEKSKLEKINKMYLERN